MQILSTCPPSLTLLSQCNPHCCGGIIAPILQIRKLRHVEAKALSKITRGLSSRGGTGILL